MSHPIPESRRPLDSRPNNPYRPPAVPGPACASCAHRTCRSCRAQTLPRLGGHRAEFALEHHKAARLQARHPHQIVWFGESTQSFWVASRNCLYEAKDWDDLLAHLWAHTQVNHPRL
ncbi:hypothetical protein [Nocardiopsis metallicus]|uniref:Uncharacterized protein n=1 Tax=Nocardiopsis metallicus TaxID=179819 RepID=A0A840VYN0_9ACTN|nr:hypothetical protein [Nocardiopsis metallicus]MBB5489610.1 hypothetical protein [Nocardiopsis metallicus]